MATNLGVGHSPFYIKHYLQFIVAISYFIFLCITSFLTIDIIYGRLFASLMEISCGEATRMMRYITTGIRSLSSSLDNVTCLS